MVENEVEEQEFLAEAAVMDLSPIKGETFCVAVATGGPNAKKFLCTTLHGPYDFSEMAQEVGDMWLQHQHHAKVILMDKDATKPIRVLSDNTVDYIECHYVDIIMEHALESIPDKEYTHTAAVVVEDASKE